MKAGRPKMVYYFDNCTVWSILNGVEEDNSILPQKN